MATVSVDAPVTWHIQRSLNLHIVKAIKANLVVVDDKLKTELTSSGPVEDVSRTYSLILPGKKKADARTSVFPMAGQIIPGRR